MKRNNGSPVSVTLVTMEKNVIMGENPPLPPYLIAQLHRRKVTVADWVWQQMADKSVTVFEGYRRRRN